MESSEDSDIEMVETYKDKLNEDGQKNHNDVVLDEDMATNGLNGKATTPNDNLSNNSSNKSSRASSIKSLNNNNKEAPKLPEIINLVEDDVELIKKAEKYKNDGNNSYKNANYKESIEFYSKAIGK
jgi:hypothetical protein